MERQRSSIEDHPIVDYDSDKSSNFNGVVSDILEKGQESQESEKELSTSRLVLLLAALWVRQNPLISPLFIINTKLIKFQFGVLLSALGAFIVFFVPLERTTKL
jgi:hypothetical protein